MKKIIALVCSVILCLGLCACEQQDPDVPEGMKLVETESKDYSLFVPEDWSVDMSTGVVSAYASLVDQSNISFTGFTVKMRDLYAETVASDDTGSDSEVKGIIDVFWDSYSEDFAETFGDTMKYIDENGEESDSPVYTRTTFGGFEANKYTYTARVTGETYKFTQLVCIEAGYVYILTYTAVTESYDEHLEDVESIIANFGFN